MQASSFFVGPHRTPKGVKWLIILTVFFSILSPVATYFFEQYLHLAGPSAWLALSLFGLKQGWLWQPLTYFFIQTAGIGISLSLIFSLFFHMLFLWFAGSEIHFRYGLKQFLLFYLGAGVFSGIIASIFLLLFSNGSVLFGSGPAVYASVFLWSMLYPDLEFFLFFLIRIKAKWFVLFYLSFALLINLSNGQLIPFIADFAGIVFAFLIGRLVWKLPNPYPLKLNLYAPKKNKWQKENKILDITVFQENDDAFMDRMLDKIAKKGEKALTKRERDRMKTISDKKSKRYL